MTLEDNNKQDYAYQATKGGYMVLTAEQIKLYKPNSVSIKKRIISA